MEKTDIIRLRIESGLKEQIMKRIINKIWETQDFTKKPNLSAYVRELIIKDLGLR